MEEGQHRPVKLHRRNLSATLRGPARIHPARGGEGEYLLAGGTAESQTRDTSATQTPGARASASPALRWPPAYAAEVLGAAPAHAPPGSHSAACSHAHARNRA